MPISPAWLVDCPVWEHREVIDHYDPEMHSLVSSFLNRPLDYEAARKRRQQGEPLEYILKHCHIDALTLKTDARALIPRVETETLVRIFTERVRNFPAGSLIDCGTGSGFIAAWLARYTDRQVIATEIDSCALALAQENFKLNDLSVSLVKTDRLRAVTGPVAGIIANLPYVNPGDSELSPEVERYEPHRALYAGEPLLGFYTEFIRQAGYILQKSGEIWLEITSELSGKLKKEFDNSSSWHSVTTHADNYGCYRFLQLIKN